jgi:hypothetical protein
VFLDGARPWLDTRRVAAVSGFGFGGTNFHAVIENHRPADPHVGRHHWPAELVAVRAATDAELGTRLVALGDRLSDARAGVIAADRWRLRDIAASVSAGGDGPVRLAIVAHDVDDLAAKVDAARAGRAATGVHRPELPLPADSGNGHGPPGVAFLLPGADAARRRMAAHLLVAFPALRSVARIGRHTIEAMLPPQPFGADHDRQEAALAAAAGPAVALASLTWAGALGLLGVTTDHMVGGGPLWPTGDDLAVAVREWLASSGASSPARLFDAQSPGAHAGRNGDSRLDAEERVTRRIRSLHEAGTRIFVEVGPGRRLTDLVERTLAGEPHVAIAVDRPDEHELTALLHAVARLAVSGVPVDIGALHAGRDSLPSRWDDPPRPPGWVVNGHFARTAAGDPLPKGLRPADEAPVITIGDRTAPIAPAASDTGLPDGTRPGDIAVVTEYLRILQGMITTGSDIVRGHVAAEQRR